jgi:hypothetical protein
MALANKLLSRSGFTLDQYCGISVRHHLHEFPDFSKSPVESHEFTAGSRQIY